MTPEEGDLSPLPRPRMLTDDVYDMLRAWLLSGRIAPDERLKIDAVAKKLGVSNTPIRQALGRLEADGLVYQEPNRGFIAASLLDARSVTEIYDVRSMVETVGAARAAQHRTDADLNALRGILAASQQDDVSSFLEADTELHLTVAKIAGNSIAVDVLDRLLIRSRSFRSMYTVPHVNSTTHDEHVAVVEAIAAGSPEQAAHAMSQHLAAAVHRITYATSEH